MAHRDAAAAAARSSRASSPSAPRPRTSARRASRCPVDFRGEPLEIGFNAEFLRDGVESVEGDTVQLKLISPLRPGLVQGEDGSFSYLIMPIRLST